MAIYFLDIDDEITSAAARIRDSSDNRIALVLTGGSRVATSRINFRLLAREARSRNKRLAIITADTSVQSVARSAELPVYASVAEYERSEATLARGADASGHAETGAALDELAMTVAPRAPNRAGGASATKISVGRQAGNPFGGIRISRPLIAGAALLVVALIAAAGFFFYPSATIVVTLRQETLGPMTVSVSVDPNVVAANDQAVKVPGLTKAFPVTASDTFQATGQNVVDTAATGTATFTSINTIQSVPVIAGTRITTPGGLAFTTQATVSVPKATVSGSTITRGAADVAILAVTKGTAGNVAAGTITKLSSDLSVFGVAVNNRVPTTGGAHTVTAKVQQSDIDAAERSLLATLEANFQTALTEPAAVPSGSSLFPESAQLGVATCSPDPAGLLNQEMDSFQLDCQATGTATMADVSGIVAMAERRARASVRTGYSLVASSLTTKVGATVTDGSALSVPVTVEAVQVPNLDSGVLRNEVLGKSLDEARTILSKYGDVKISVSPDWASSLPSFDFRIDLQLVVPTLEPVASPSFGASPEVTKRPTVVPRTPPPTPAATPTPVPSPVGPSPSASPTGSTPPSAAPSPTDAPTATPTPTPTPT
jgi:hypothetical protein